MSTVAEPPKDSTNGEGVDGRREEVMQYLRRDVPICPQHGLMRAYMTRGRVTYYACRDECCDRRGKAIARIV